MKKPYFKIYRHETNMTFLYQKDEGLFFISYTCLENGDIFLKGSPVTQCHEQKNMSFYLVTDSYSLEAKQLLHLSSERYTFKICKTYTVEMQNVCVKVEIEMSPTVWITKDKLVADSAEAEEVKTILAKFNKTFPRKISIRKPIFIDTVFSLGPNKRYIIKKYGGKSYNIFLDCLSCLNVTLTPTDLFDGFFIKIGKYFFNICNSCLQYQLPNNEIMFVPFSSVLNIPDMFIFETHEKMLHLETLPIHPTWTICPINDCNYFCAKLDVVDHIQTNHKLMQLNNFASYISNCLR